MKKATSELSLTVIVLIVITSVLVLTTIIINSQSNTIATIINKLIGEKNEESINTTKNEQIEPVKNNNKKIYTNNNLENINNTLNKNIVTIETLENHPEIKNTLQDSTSKIVKKIKNNKNSCVNSCGDFGNINSSSYFKTNNGYIVNITDEENNSYSISYNYKKNIFGKEKYNINTIYNDTNSINSINTINNKLVNNESKTDNLKVNYKYNEEYISQANIKQNPSFTTNEKITEDVYKKNIDSIVLLNTYSDGKIINNANGFFIAPGIIATSWSYVLDSIKENGIITALTPNNNSYNILGAITSDKDSDIVLIKIDKNIGTPVTFGDIALGDEVLALGSFSGFGISGNVGINIGNDSVQATSLYTTDKNLGSPLFNSKGEVIGMLTNTNSNSSLTNSISSNIIKEYKKYYDNIDYNKINYYTFNELTTKYYNLNIKEEKIDKVSDDNIVWSKYKDNYDLSKFTDLDLIKYNYNDQDNEISIRYKNDTNIENDIIILSYIDNLKNKGYKELLNSNKKKKYSGEYEITIYYEFDYIILIIRDV